MRIRRIFDPHEIGDRLTFLAVGFGHDSDAAARATTIESGVEHPDR